MALIFGTNGSDLRDGTGGADTISGGPNGGNPLLEIGNDTLHGLGGDDLIDGLGGDDLITGDGGLDTIFGGDGNDTIIGGSGRLINGLYYGNRAFGGAGNDFINVGKMGYALGDTGDDTILGGSLSYGGLGNDLIETDYNDSADGGAGNDTITVLGGHQTNILLGDAGDDSLTGGGVIEGGTGNDTITADKYTFIMFGGAGNDVITMSDLRTVNTKNAQAQAGDGNDQVIGSSTRDVLFGEGGDDLILAGGGNDYLDGDFTGASLGNDTMIGEAGNDFFFSSAGVDSLDGGTGSDTAWIQRTTATVALSFTLTSVNASTVLLGDGTTVTGIENFQIIGGSGNDTFSTTGGADDLRGSAGDDSLNGGAGDDMLWGGFGTDTLVGGLGNDFLSGNTGIDSMAGNLGNDTYHVDEIGDQIVENAGEGIDTVMSWQSLTLGANLERLFLMDSAELDGTGNELRNVLAGNDADNVLSGEDGNDRLVGRQGNDTLLGGNDDDVLVGSIGADELTGGTGADHFLLRSIADSETDPVARDIVTDFATGDKIDVSLIDANWTVADDQAFTLDVDGSFSVGEIKLEMVGSDLLVSFNIIGDDNAEMAILVQNTSSLTEADFVL